MPRRESVLVDERKAGGSRLFERAETKAEQNTPLDPCVERPVWIQSMTVSIS
jgi:hypothetical protein